MASRQISAPPLFLRKQSLAAVLLCSTLVCGRVPLWAENRREAGALAKKARKAEKKGQDAQAYLLYSEAAALRPSNDAYRAQMLALQSRAALQNTSAPLPAIPSGAGPVDDPTPDPAIDPDQVFSSLTEREFAKARQPQAAPTVAAKDGRVDFDITGDARMLFDNVTRSFGLDTVYDGDYPQNGPRIHFRIAGADYREALRALEAATSSFLVPLSPKLLMIAKDNPQKRNDLERTITVTVPVPQVLAAQELTEIVAAIRQATNVEKVAWDTAHGEIVIRDRMSRALPAQLLLNQLVNYRPQISIELEFLQVSNSDIRNYGFNVANTFSLTYLGHILNYQPSLASGVTNLLTFGGGKTLFGMGVAQAEAVFNQTLSNARSLFRTTVRSADGQAATFHVGEKYPIITAGYYGTTPPNSGTVYTPPPSYTFEDLGIVLKVTPHVHGEGEMSLVLETTYEVLAGQAVNGIPVIGERKLATQVRLRNGEWAIVAGLMNQSRQKSESGFWGLAQIPLLGRLFKQTSTDKEDNAVLIVIKPTLLALGPDQVVTRALHVGSEVRPFTPL